MHSLIDTRWMLIMDRPAARGFPETVTDRGSTATRMKGSHMTRQARLLRRLESAVIDRRQWNVLQRDMAEIFCLWYKDLSIFHLGPLVTSEP